LAFCALLLASLGASAAATYTFQSANYDTTGNFVGPCGTGNCANFSLAMNTDGSFTGPTRLAPNLPGVDITAALTSFTFNDGLTTYSSTDPQVRVYQFLVATDATGAITAVNILIERWQTGGAVHVLGDRFDYINIVGAGQVLAQHNFPCTAVGPSPAGTADSCTGTVPDASSSTASAAAAGVFALGAAAEPIPTLGEYALLLLAALMGIAGAAGVRRNGAAA
jgi:hypothetical protein